MELKNLSEEIKNLREALGLNQVSFSVKLQKSLSTVTRYERGEVVDLHDITKMVNWAREAGRDDLARQFRNALLNFLGPDVVKLVQEEDESGHHRKEAPGKGSGDKRRISA